MRRLRLITSVFLLMIFAFIYSCNHEDEVKPVVDYRCKVTTSSSAEKVFCHNPIAIDVDVEMNDASIGNYIFSYTIVEGSGDLIINNEIFLPGEERSININNFKPCFVPKKLGEHKLLFRFENKEYKTESVYVVKANELAFEASAINLPRKVLIDKATAFDIQLRQKNFASETKSFNAQLQMLKGNAYVNFVSADTNSTLEKFSIKSDSIFTRAAGTPRPVTDYEVNIGNNKVHFKSAEKGENIILLSVENEYGYKQDLNIPLNIELPEFNVKTTSDTIGNVGSINNFLLHIEDTDNFGDNIYNVTYRNIKNSGVLKINNNEIQVGATLELQKGDNVCEFIPHSLGETTLEFIVKDKYNTTHKDTVYFNSVRSYADIFISDYDSTTTIYDARTISFAVDKKDYSGKFYLDLASSPNGTANIKINGIDYAGGRVEITNKQNTIISFIPQNIGPLDFILKVYDDYNSETTKNIHFNVINSSGQLFISNHNPVLNIFTLTSFNFGINKPNYTGSYQYEIEMYPVDISEIGKHYGTITIDNEKYQGGRKSINNTNNTTVYFTPTQTGDVRLRLSVYDDFGGCLQEELEYKITNTDIKVYVTGIASSINLGEETSFTVNAQKNYFDGELNLSIINQGSDFGSIKVNNTTYIPGQVVRIKNNQNNTITYCPSGVGEANYLVKVSDDWGSEATYPVRIKTVNSPLQLECMNYTGDAIINTESNFHINVSKPNYTGKFSFTINTQPANSGKILVDGAEYKTGPLDLKANGADICFIPDQIGKTTLTISAQDAYGTLVSRDFIFKVANPDLKVQISNIEDNLTLNKKSSFSISINKEGYKGKFFCEINTENAEHLVVGGKEYPGKRVELENPLGTTIDFIPVCVGHDTVKLSIKILDEWGSCVEKNMKFSVTNSDIELKLSNADRTVFSGKETTFEFSATKPNYTDNLEYELILKPKNAGILNVEGKEYIDGLRDYVPGTEIPVRFIPVQPGQADLKIVVKDKWGAEKSQTLAYTINTTDIIMELTDVVTDATLNQASVFTMSLSKLYYNGQYNYSIVSTPANCGVIKVNDEVYEGGRKPVSHAKNTTISFTPTKAGNVSLKLNVTDTISGEVSKTVSFHVKNNPINIIVANQEVGLTLNRETFFNFSANKEDYDGKFFFELVSEPVSIGDLQVNGTAYQGGRIEMTNPNNTRINYIPRITGDVKILVKIYDELGCEVEKELAFNVKNSEFITSIGNQEPEIIYNTPTSFTLSVMKENYNKGFKYEILQNPENAGTIKINGSAYSEGKKVLEKPSLTLVEFTSTQAGKNIVTFKIYDEFGGSIDENIYFNVTNPELNVNISNHTADLKVNATGQFNFTVSKEHYTGKFKAQIEQLPAGMGTITLDGKTYDGTETELAKLSNVVTFTPSKTGAVTLKLTVKDEWGVSKVVEVPFSVSNTDMIVQVSNKENELYLNNTTNLNFNVSKPNYEGTFKARIVQEPEQAGEVKINNSSISDETVYINNSNTLSFNPRKTGAVLLKLIVMDDLGGEKEVALNFNVTNPELNVNISNHTADLKVNATGQFNFTVSKEHYTGKFKAQIEQLPAGMGTITLDGKGYDGTETELAKLSNVVTFTPSKTGAVTLKLTVKDEWGVSKVVEVPFSVSNTDMIVQVSNKEHDLLLNKTTRLNFDVSKPSYTGGFKAKIVQEPKNTGTVRLNNSVISDENLVVIPANSNSLEFTPEKTGAVLLRLIVTDDLGGEKEVALNFNVTNPDININVTNKESDLTYNKKTSFNIAVSKSDYKGTYKYELIQNPAASGTLEVDGKAYSGGIQNVTNPNNIAVSYTPQEEGYVSILIRITDETGLTAEKTIGFNVVNAPVILTIGKPSSTDMTIGQSTSFTVKAEKENYNGNFNYEITSIPVDAGEIKINGKTSMTGELKPNPSTVTFTPSKVGNAYFQVKVRDSGGKIAEESIYFAVNNTPMNISFANQEENIVLNTPTEFTFKVIKDNYPDNKLITYTVSPAYTGTLVIDGKDYTGTSIEIPYSRIKNGINVRYTPDREGTKGLSFTAKDEFNGFTAQTINFNISNPELQLYLTGVNTEAPNEVNLGSTYKFYYNINKANYNDEFAYWLTLDPQEVGIIGTSDATPRGKTLRSGGGVDIQTGTIQANPHGATTGEIRFTPSNADYLNQTISVNVRIRDKWNNEKEQTVKFKVVTSAIELNVNRKTSIPVEEPYTFYFTVNKQGYSGTFKYSLVGWADGDKLEISADNSRWTTYSGGKFDLPNKDHTYIRYTPAAINTIPLRLFVYDNQNGEAMQELTFDVKAPEVKLTADALSKPGYLNEFVPFTLTAEETKGEYMNVSFSLDDPSFSGELKFNDNTVTPTSSRTRAAASNFTVASGSNNKLEMMAYSKGTWGVTTTAANRWQQSASVTTSIHVSDKPNYTLNVTTEGEGKFTVKASDNTNGPSYKEGTVITLTATPASGWKFVKWTGDVTSTNATVTVTMDGNKNVQAVFEKGYVITSTGYTYMPMSTGTSNWIFMVSFNITDYSSLPKDIKIDVEIQYLDAADKCLYSDVKTLIEMDGKLIGSSGLAGNLVPLAKKVRYYIKNVSDSRFPIISINSDNLIKTEELKQTFVK